MKSQVKTLKLFEDIIEAQLTLYRNGVSMKNLAPDKKEFLLDGRKTEKIPAGDYFFVQNFLINGADESQILENMAESLYLEALWQEIEFLDDCVYARKLKEGSSTVLQLFRPLK